MILYSLRLQTKCSCNILISGVAFNLNCLDQDFPFSDIGVDKSTASQAVALVIRASRRGIVSLCAEVADLLKEKNRLGRSLCFNAMLATLSKCFM